MKLIFGELTINSAIMRLTDAPGAALLVPINEGVSGEACTSGDTAWSYSFVSELYHRN